MRGSLTKREKEKIDRQNTTTRKNSIILSRHLLKNSISNVLKTNSDDIEILNKENITGKPFVLNQGVSTNLDVSISYCYPLVGVIFSDSNVKVGIDIENIFSNSSDLFLHFSFSTKEIEYLSQIYPQQFLDRGYTTLWCIKEAVGKLLGIGLSGNPKGLEVFLISEKEVSVSFRDDSFKTKLFFKNKKLFLSIRYVDTFCICYTKVFSQKEK
ncbi:hypothetical protein PB1A_1094 [Leuconostoc inhae]|uniref:4'-phosphopantetheinyl transferase domain-containing protein n=3 Tax=Lactobacillaceae TaxID=33958 RepID=A0AAN2QXB5_9LACO|nr:4'-phosphopantetheinyl transferase superfamily [Leuconostoc gasicomitatum LMG 18811]CUW06479.1 hypothetical protein KSL4_0658 [Leuconostoc inhae]CUW13033.1 hypothetical protein C122C_1729 [Leuconostoc gasicomitatum]CUW10206.1 hypothetical protein PB1A_1094 [Leuconostoc inhae]CUW15583.1 hypothetical protein C120C_1455 [Leuconostoc inhae]